MKNDIVFSIGAFFIYCIHMYGQCHILGRLKVTLVASEYLLYRFDIFSIFPCSVGVDILTVVISVSLGLPICSLAFLVFTLYIFKYILEWSFL